MANLSRRLLAVLTTSFIISIACLGIGWLSHDRSMAQTLFGGIGLYGTLITIGVFAVYLLSLLIGFGRRH